MKRREEPEERERRRDVAYERGWKDSLTAYYNMANQPDDDRYDYGKGWEACAKYRWEDPANRGAAPDPSYRIPRS